MTNIAPQIKLKMILLLIYSILLFNGCKTTDVSGLVKEDEKQIAEKFITQLQAGEIDSLYEVLTPQIKNENTKETMEKLQCLIPKEHASNYRYLKFTRQLTGEKKTTYLRIQADYSSSVAFYEIGFSRKDDDIELLNFHFNLTQHGSEISAPLLIKTMLHPLRFVFGLLVFVIPIFTIFTIVLLFMTKNIKRKWLWFVFMLFGLGQFKLNWFAGTMNFNILSFQILGSGFMAESSYGPLFVSISIPVGAILFLIRRKELAKIIEEKDVKVINDENKIKKENIEIKNGGD